LAETDGAAAGARWAGAVGVVLKVVADIAVMTGSPLP
jgi:hypothetical protein